MADLFSTYEQDFKLALQEAESKFSSVSTNSGLRTQTIRAIESATDEALEILDQMNIEVQNVPASSRSTFNTKIRQYRRDVDTIKTKLKGLTDEDSRAQLFGLRYTDEEAGVHDDQRKQLLSNNASLERSTDRLRESQRIALETENIGGNILNDLRAQREQITNLRNTLLAADLYVDKSILTLKSMTRRITANKFISYAIIGVLILLIFLVLASKFM
ncbi:hypothetical protein PUMCH_000649 [Australozyma saopauloensis]|uniref:t-SNARE coiled-coil homology domain-containing protein n=1 Tax=Australozyma saopauloensis TaxID=291208 RepID=A0AAX4H4A9_9ASCO|nr:hypothetical protein PUMCH_000649 [[Candida] saopauloensis]